MSPPSLSPLFSSLPLVAPNSSALPTLQVKAVHEAFINNGANVIETNTFSANRFCLHRYGLTNIAEINAAGVKIALEAAADGGKGTIVAGAVGPTGEGTGFIDDEKAKEIEEALAEQVGAVNDGRILPPVTPTPPPNPRPETLKRFELRALKE